LVWEKTGWNFCIAKVFYCALLSGRTGASLRRRDVVEVDRVREEAVALLVRANADGKFCGSLQRHHKDRHISGGSQRKRRNGVGCADGEMGFVGRRSSKLKRS